MCAPGQRLISGCPGLGNLDTEVEKQLPWCHMNKKHHRIAADVKADILRRVKEEGIPVAQAAKEHGISEGTIYGWMVKGATGAPSWAEFSRLQKQNRELLELVGEITLKLSMAQKNS